MPTVKLAPPGSPPARPAAVPAATAPGTAQAAILRRGADSGRLTHLQHIPARRGRRAQWPDWLPPELSLALSQSGAGRPWAHQARAARLAR